MSCLAIFVSPEVLASQSRERFTSCMLGELRAGFYCLLPTTTSPKRFSRGPLCGKPSKVIFSQGKTLSSHLGNSVVACKFYFLKLSYLNMFEQAPGDGEGQGSLACCSPWGHRVGRGSMTEQRPTRGLQLRTVLPVSGRPPAA